MSHSDGSAIEPPGLLKPVITPAAADIRHHGKRAEARFSG
jgi:hypothetical protein